MSKLTEFYQHKAAILKSSESADKNTAQWDALEERLIREDLMPRLMQRIAPLLQEVQSAVSVNINYDPAGTIALNFTRNCLQLSLGNAIPAVPTPAASQPEPEVEIPSKGTETQNNAQPELTQEPEEKKETPSPEKATRVRQKSIGFSVTFPDNTVIHERKAVRTFINALKKIGLERIANENHGIEHIGYKVVGTKLRLDENGEDSGNQTKEDGYYVYTRISNDQKIKDLQALGDYFKIPLIFHEITDDGPIPIVPSHDDEVEEAPAAQIPSDLPIKEQFKLFLQSRVSKVSIDNYLRYLDHCVRDLIKELVDDKADSIFSFTTPDEVDLCIQLLEESEKYHQVNVDKHHYPSASLKQWKAFVEHNLK